MINNSSCTERNWLQLFGVNSYLTDTFFCWIFNLQSMIKSYSTSQNKKKIRNRIRNLRGVVILFKKQIFWYVQNGRVIHLTPYAISLISGIVKLLSKASGRLRLFLHNSQNNTAAATQCGWISEKSGVTPFFDSFCIK